MATISDEDFKKVSEEVYKQNFELAIRNKTLTVLRTLYAMVVETLSLAEMAQKIVDSIGKELNFPAVLLSMVDQKDGVLRPLAITQTKEIMAGVSVFGKPLEELLIDSNYEGNLILVAIRKKERQITTNLLDILVPLATQEVADKIENTTGIKTIIVYPVIVGEVQAALSVGLAKKVDDLSRAERETLEELIYVLGIALERVILYEELQVANAQLVKLDKIKDEFVSLASHELRTPMTAIKSYGWLILNNKAGEINEQVKKYMEIIYSSTERLINLVNDMLDLSRIESGKVKLKVEKFDICKLLEELRLEFEARANEKKLGWSIECPAPPIEISGDREKILQVLENLVGNAVKFTQTGSVKVEVKMTGMTGIEISVVDTGRGIATEDLAKLFTKFGRVENSLTGMSEGGTGLGLYLSKQYVEMHGGKINIESQVGQGSRFWFNLPI